jgi:protein tyrosine/serine phosphatase
VRLIALLLVSACAPVAVAEDSADDRPVPAIAVDKRPAGWAVALDEPGLPNLHRVATGLMRGAQPTAEGVHRLEQLGIKTVISLRAFHDDDDQIAGTALAHERISFKSWHPEDEDVVRFLRLVTDPARQPVFVHCQHGADRTGMMCAIYRMVVQGWSADEAAREMVEGGYGFHAVWKDLVEYVRKVDVVRLRREAGIADPEHRAGGPAPSP